MSLPPLPGSLAVFTPTRDQHVKLNWIVRKYGELCRKMALEEVIEHFQRKHELCKTRHNYWLCAAIEMGELK